jgi:uncharacterized membrane protein SpoIIM required for sporulation
MGKREFIESRRDSWQETENLLARIRRSGLSALREDELLHLGGLYRSITTDLAKAQSVEPYGDVALYLNRLVASTHAVIYVDQAQPLRSFVNFIKSGFPSLIRKHTRVVILSSLIFLLPSLLGFYWMGTNPVWLDRFFPQLSEQIAEMEDALQSGPSMLASGIIKDETMPIMSTRIMVNNIEMSIYAFATGITFGLMTAYILITNGVLLGSVGFLYLTRPSDYVLYFLAGILPHGVIELTAIVFSGTAGFLLAGALIMPGNLRRMDALQYHSHDAIQIMYGVGLMLVIAGLIEGFITPIRIEGAQGVVDYLKIGFAVLLGILLIIYFSFAGRPRMKKS